jgi:hypothetical protein
VLSILIYIIILQLAQVTNVAEVEALTTLDEQIANLNQQLSNLDVQVDVDTSG